jgi:phospholipid/cholesterol/gamma-HCH transport system ATP-binding protein
LRLTSVVVTHDIASANYVADRIAFLYDGKILRVASADEMRASDDPLISAFLSGGQSGA